MATTPEPLVTVAVDPRRNRFERAAPLASSQQIHPKSLLSLVPPLNFFYIPAPHVTMAFAPVRANPMRLFHPQPLTTTIVALVASATFAVSSPALTLYWDGTGTLWGPIPNPGTAAWSTSSNTATPNPAALPARTTL